MADTETAEAPDSATADDFDDEFAEDTSSPSEPSAETSADGEKAGQEVQDPGDKLFGDVVNDAASTRPPIADKPTVEATGDVQLRDSVVGIYEMVKDLEVQLNHMVSINEAAERDIEVAKRSQRALEKERDDLRRALDETKLDAQSSAELREELRHMTRENERLVEQVRRADEQTHKWESERSELATDRARANVERDGLREEVECLEDQLAQAGPYVESLRADLASVSDARGQQTRKVDLVEQRLYGVTDERDSLRQELNESRAALEEIRRSIMDTNMQSQRSYYDS